MGKGSVRDLLRRSLVTHRDSDFGFRSVKYCLVRLGQAVRKDAAWDSRKVGRCLRYVRTKVVFDLWILKTVLVCVFRHNGRLCYWCFSPLHCSSQCCDAEDGRGWRLPGLIGFIVYITLSPRMYVVMYVVVRLLYLILC